MLRAFAPDVSLVLALACAAAAPLAGAGCQGRVDVHATDEARGKACASCHAAAYKTAKNPVHVNLMPQTCADCHNTREWSPVDFGPEKHRWFPLQNKHDGPACAACHTKGYKLGETPKDCAGCHQKDYDAAREPVHAGFPSDCKVCHNDRGWKPNIFTHPWPLTNKHATTPCASCHTGNPPRWAGMPTDCLACHKKDYDAAQNPIHGPIPPTTGMLVGGRTCVDCHASGGGTPQGGWRPSTFVHPTAPFALTGTHADPSRVSCNDCHAVPKPAGTSPRGYASATMPSTCIDCHRTGPGSFAYEAAPNHVSGSYSTECRLCHDTTEFKGAALHPESKFTLVSSRHSNEKCLDCHDVTRGVSKGGVNVDCVTCHGYSQGVWANAHALPPLDQRHVTKGIPACGAGQTPGPVSCFPNNTQTNADRTICRACHPLGQK
jgi:nitrate/TMAO reductase-like tetraheme cytochrome c subunit